MREHRWLSMPPMTLIALIVLFGMSAEARGQEAGAAAFEAGELARVSSAQARFDRLAAGGQASTQGFSTAERPSVLSAIEIQGLLESDTALLVYSLGDQQSSLFWVTRDTIRSFQLPPRAEIESMARHLMGLYSIFRPHDGANRQAADSLGRVLLDPLGDLLKNQRLVVVADGELGQVPFAMLPQPGLAGGTGQDRVPLLDRHEIVYLPSASALARQRRLLARQPAALFSLVVADPVFTREDPRFSASPGAESAAGWAPLSGPRLERLPWTHVEAESIASLVASGQVKALLGFDANRSAVLSSETGRYRYIHFATACSGGDGTQHSSSLILSRIDQNGLEVDGSLHAADIIDAKLGAELVVLSGCGDSVSGAVDSEAQVWLGDALLYGGAGQVVTSSWQVRDGANVELMSRFYRAMWTEGMSPAAALRTAQLSLFRERRWHDPHFWAGVRIHGG